MSCYNCSQCDLNLLLLQRKDSCLPDAYKLVLSYNQLDILLLCEFLFTKSCEEPQRFWFLKGGIQEVLGAFVYWLEHNA